MPNENTTRRILDSAKASFLHNGYEATSLKTVCKQAGVTTGAFYHRFAGKYELYRSVVEPAVAKLFAMLDDCMETADSSGMPESWLDLVYLYWDEFRITVRCRCTPQYKEFCSGLESRIFQLLFQSSDNAKHEQDLAWLLSKAYLNGFLEVVRCDYDFDMAKNCILMLDQFLVQRKSAPADWR